MLFFFSTISLYIFLLFFSRDNYGFVTFDSKKDAFSAIEHGNDDTSYPKVDLCFGGRRAFCKEKYADLGMYTYVNVKRKGIASQHSFNCGVSNKDAE
jgi:hypothetical protein